MPPRRGAIVLAGGGSRRMGVDKSALAWRGRPLLLHVLDAVRSGLALGDAQGAPVVVVHAPGQELPSLPGGVRALEDTVAGRGPLQGLHDGLAALAADADVAFVASTDVPLLRPELVAAVLDAVGENDAAVPCPGGRPQPLVAAYRTSLVALADELLEAGERRVTALVGRCGARLLEDAWLRGVDPGLRSLANVNAPADLAALDAADAEPGA